MPVFWAIINLLKYMNIFCFAMFHTKKFWQTVEFLQLWLRLWNNYKKITMERLK